VRVKKVRLIQHLTPLDLVMRAFEELEVRSKGEIRARIDFYCCDMHAIEAAEEIADNTIFCSKEALDECFLPIVVHFTGSPDNPEVVELIPEELEARGLDTLYFAQVGRRSKPQGALSVNHHWRDSRESHQQTVTTVLNEYGLLVEWDKDPEKPMKIHF